MRLLCIAKRHRWVETNTDGPYPVLRCGRCGRGRAVEPARTHASLLADRERRLGPELGWLAPTRFRR